MEAGGAICEHCCSFVIFLHTNQQLGWTPAISHLYELNEQRMSYYQNNQLNNLVFLLQIFGDCICVRALYLKEYMNTKGSLTRTS